MKLGIVGLPNVGKSTLFNSLTKAGALSANYPFATIDPNVGIVSVPDERIVKLGELYHTKKVTPATIEFVDIAGLVKGASKGEGLGNQFLANIREVDAIVHVVRCFEDTNIIHVDGSIDPARDIETINLELIFSDIEILDRRIAKIAKQARMDKTLAKELELVEAVKAHLEEGRMARTFEVPDDDDAQIWFKGYNLLTAKPVIYAANVAEDDLADDGASNPHVAKVREMAKEEGAEVFVICAQIEQELAELDEDEKKDLYRKEKLFRSYEKGRIHRKLCRMHSRAFCRNLEEHIHNYNPSSNKEKRLLELITEGMSLIAKDSPYILNYDYDYASEKERDFEPPPLEYQILLTYSITDTVTKDMESCFSTDCQETYNQTPVSFTFITPETEKLFRPENYPERFSKWFEKFVEHVTYNL